MNTIYLFSVAALVVCVGMDNADAQVKRCTDAQGKVTYTQTACPKATAKDKTIMAYTPVSNAEPSQGRDWQEENRAFHQRQAQRHQVESAHQAAFDAFNAAVNKPLLPGQTRETTLTISTPNSTKVFKKTSPQPTQ